MAAPKICDEVVAEVVKRAKHGESISSIARELKLDRGCVGKYVRRLVPNYSAGGPSPQQTPNVAINSLDVDGSVNMLTLDRPRNAEEMAAFCNIDTDIWTATDHLVNTWQGGAKFPVPGTDGKTWKWEKCDQYQSKTRFKRIMAEEVEAAILRFTRKHVKPLPKKRVARGRTVAGGYMMATGKWDAHLGMYAWAAETGNNFDLKIATSRMFNATDDLIRRLGPYQIDRIYMPIGNDFMHYDSVRKKTTFGEHWMDCDTRFGLVYEAGLECLAYDVERFSEICNDIRLLYVPGNHDMKPSYCMCSALQQRYRNDKRIKVDLGFRPRKWVTWGECLIMFDHGHKVKHARWPAVMMDECRNAISAARYMEVQVGHRHSEHAVRYPGVDSTGGLLVRQNPCLSNTDEWHYAQGFVGNRKAQNAWLYDREAFQTQLVAWVRDDGHDEAVKALRAHGERDLISIGIKKREKKLARRKRARSS